MLAFIVHFLPIADVIKFHQHQKTRFRNISQVTTTITWIVHVHVHVLQVLVHYSTHFT